MWRDDLGARNAELSWLRGVRLSPRIMARNCGLSELPHEASCFHSSYTEIPSLSQRGILLLVLHRVVAWQNSCQSTASQFEGCSPCDAGLFAVITRPKQTPSRPSAPGRPKVRTANSFFCGKISTITGPGS